MQMSPVDEEEPLLNMSDLSRILVVVHCERGDDNEILYIILARKATKAEQCHYRVEKP